MAVYRIARATFGWSHRNYPPDQRPDPDNPNHFVSCVPDTPETREMVLKAVAPILRNMTTGYGALRGTIVDRVKPATASGTVKFTGDEGHVVPRVTLLRPAGDDYGYYTIEAGTIVDGEVVVPVRCCVPHSSSGNRNPGTLLEVEGYPPFANPGPPGGIDPTATVVSMEGGERGGATTLVASFEFISDWGPFTYQDGMEWALDDEGEPT